MKSLENKLRALRDDGRKVLVPYFMAGATPDWTQHVSAAIFAGADAVEIGVPFSDPMIDGAVVQAAGERSLAAGTTIDSMCAELLGAHFDAPLVVMTYYNLFHHYGLRRAAGRLSESGIQGAIVPDLTLEESQPWRDACDETDIATVFLVAPSTTRDRFTSLTRASQGFCYASARMAVTGPAQGDGDASRVVEGVRAVSDIPTYVGIGISTPDQAARATQHADGVIVGSALVDTILNGATPGDTEAFIRSFRRAIDK